MLSFVAIFVVAHQISNSFRLAENLMSTNVVRTRSVVRNAIAGEKKREVSRRRS
jgi:hypothetical protein